MRGGCGRHRGTEAGFTLLELSIALLISLTALLLAGRLLLEAESRLAHAARRAFDPVGELAAEQLRADLRAAAEIEAPLVSGWSRDPLRLRDHPAGELRYLVAGEVPLGDGAVAATVTRVGTARARVDLRAAYGRGGRAARAEVILFPVLEVVRWEPMTYGL